MNYNLEPKLATMSVVRIGFEMWRQSDARSLFSNVKSDEMFNRKSWDSTIKEIGEQLLEKVSELEVPRSFQARIKSVIRPMGKEILEFFVEVFATVKPRFGTDLIDHFCWTPFGIIDEMKTAQSFLEKGVFNVEERFQLACKYICKDYIPVLSKELLSQHDQYLAMQYGISISDLSGDDCCEKCLEKYWFSCVGDSTGLTSRASREYVFHLVAYSIIHCNFAAFTDFWKKFDIEEKEKYVVNLASLSLRENYLRANGKLSMITIFLLSQMNRKQQMSLFELHSFCIVKCFGNFWYFHDFFLPTVKIVWDSIDGGFFRELLEIAAKNLSENAWESEKYERWFLELWTQSRSLLKEYNVIEYPNVFVKYLADGKNFETIKLIIDETNGEERKDLFKSMPMKQTCIHLMLAGDFKFLDKLLTHSLSCVEVRYMVQHMLHDRFIFSALISRSIWMALDRLLNYFGDLSEERVCELKREFFLMEGSNFCSHFVDGGDVSSIEKFLTWASSTTEEVKELKKALITKNGGDLCIKLLQQGRGRLKFVDNLVRDCFSSEGEISEFKKDLMLSREAIKFYDDHVEIGFYVSLSDDDSSDHDVEDYVIPKVCHPFIDDLFLPEVTEWFNVSSEQQIEFLQKFEEYVNATYPNEHQARTREKQIGELRKIFGI